MPGDETGESIKALGKSNKLQVVRTRQVLQCMNGASLTTLRNTKWERDACKVMGNPVPIIAIQESGYNLGNYIIMLSETKSHSYNLKYGTLAFAISVF